MRKSFDGLMAIIRDVYELDSYANAVYLFCGRAAKRSKLSILIKMESYSFKNGLMATDGSSGPGMLQRPAS